MTTSTNHKPNQYPGPCRNCGGNVPAGAGRLGGKVDGRWTVAHIECPTTQPETPVQPTSTVPEFTPTPEQMECVKLFATGSDLVIQAGAGAGKTSTLKLLANYALGYGQRGWYGAFNKAIVVDTASKMPGNVSCSTMHSLAFAAVGREYKHRLNGRRQRLDEVASLLGIDPFSIPFGTETKTLRPGWLAGKVMKAVGRFCRSADVEITARHFEYIDGVDLPDDNGNRTYTNNDAVASYLLPYARKAWDDLRSTTGQLRFSHDVYLKIWSLSDPRIDVDFILFDEAQDADPVQVAIIENQRQYGVQIVVVGDEQQVIYDWRGAVDALARFEEMGANVAFLSQSFRFGDAVADVANGLLSRLDARLRIRGFGQVATTVGPMADPDAILTRSNAGAVRLCLTEIENGRRPYLVGGGSEVVSFCEAALLLQSGRHTSHPELACFDNWAAVQDFVDNDEQGDELRLMVKLIDQFGAQVIIDALGAQGREEDADVVISTAHKSKGREWDRVQIGPDFHGPKDGQSDLSPAELRLAYVAVTRAKRALDISSAPHMGPDFRTGRRSL